MQHLGDPADHLAELLTAYTFGQSRLSPLARRWLVGGLLRFVREGGRLDEALGLSGPGMPRMRTRLLQQQRDMLLARALAAVAIGDHVTAWARCQRLVPVVRQVTAQWPRLSRLQSPPADWSACKQRVFEAAAVPLGRPLPCTAMGLHQVAKRMGGFSLCSLDHTMLANYL